MKELAEKLIEARKEYLTAEAIMWGAKDKFDAACKDLAEAMIDALPCLVVNGTAIVLDADYALGDSRAEDSFSFYSVWQAKNEVGNEVHG
jgi:hypothetical protein